MACASDKAGRYVGTDSTCTRGAPTQHEQSTVSRHADKQVARVSRVDKVFDTGSGLGQSNEPQSRVYDSTSYRLTAHTSHMSG